MAQITDKTGKTLEATRASIGTPVLVRGFIKEIHAKKDKISIYVPEGHGPHHHVDFSLSPSAVQFLEATPEQPAAEQSGLAASPPSPPPQPSADA